MQDTHKSNGSEVRAQKVVILTPNSMQLMLLQKSIHARLERLVFEAEEPLNTYPKPYKPLAKATAQQLEARLQLLYDEVRYLMNEVQLCAFLQTL
mgnify:CR=1 FL=1